MPGNTAMEKEDRLDPRVIIPPINCSGFKYIYGHALMYQY